LLAALALATCSSSQRRDQNYGTDAGAGYRPEAAAFASPDTSATYDTLDGLEDASDEAGPDEAGQGAQDADPEVGF
jgi:hypothetical protein